MEVVREVVRLGRNLRKKEGHRVRQPLAGLTILSHDPRVIQAVEGHAGIIADELNVKSVSATGEEESLVHLSAKANFRKLGPALGSRMQEVAAAIAGLGPEDLEKILDGGEIEVAGQRISQEDLFIERTAREGVIVETGPDFACALDTTIDDALVSEGIAREIISRVQRLRREAGLDVTDRIALYWSSDDPDVANAMESHGAAIAGEVLAATTSGAEPSQGEVVDIDGRRVTLAIARVG
jgi:isoleucyl-tRNA synthetase